MEHRFRLDDLSQLTRDILVEVGLTPAAAADASAALAYADRHGLATHGVNQIINNYVPALRSGKIDPDAVAVVVGGQRGVRVLDGRCALGPVTMTAAADLAGDLAGEHGVGVAAVRNSGHFGAAGYYAHRLSQRGMVGLVMTNCGAQGVVPPLGGSVRMLGTNPLAAAVPAGEQDPFVLDMSTTAVATGRVKAAARDGQRVPGGWLLDPRTGQDVDDPHRYLDQTADVAWLGTRLASGAAKGFGLGLLVDLLCGPLAGAAFGPQADALTDVEPAEDTDVGHLAMALDLRAFGDPEVITQRSAELLQTVAACPPAGYATTVTYPGAPEASFARSAEQQGVVLPAAIADGLHELAAELGLTMPAAVRLEGTSS